MEIASIDPEKIERLAGAIASGDAELTAKLIEDRLLVNARSVENRTPLHLAAESGNIGIATLLLLAGADADAIDGGGRAPLHLAAESGNLDMVRLLYAHGASHGVKDARGRSAIDIARARGFDSVVEFIAEKLAHVDFVPARDDVRADSSSGGRREPPAAGGENKDVGSARKAILKFAPAAAFIAAAAALVFSGFRGIVVKSFDEKDALEIIRTPDAAALNSMIGRFTAGGDAERRLGLIIEKIIAAESCEAALAIEKDIFDGGGTLEAKIRQAFLEVSARRGRRFSSPKKLIDHGFDNFHRLSEVRAIAAIAANFDTTEVDLLFAARAAAEFERGNFPALAGAAGTFKNCRTAGSGPFKKVMSSIEKITANRREIEKFATDAAKKNGEENLADGMAETEIKRLAEENEVLAASASAIMAGIKLDAGRNAIKYIAAHEFSPLERLCGSFDLNGTDASGETLLVSAVKSGSIDVCRRLLELGADPNQAGGFSRTPLDLASAAGNEALVSLLRSAGAKTSAEIKVGEEEARLRKERERHDAFLEMVTRNDLAGLTAADMKDINIDRRLDNGQTYLILAVTLNNLQAVKFLLSRGADTNARDAGGMRAIDHAKALRYGDVYEALTAAENKGK